MWFIVGLGNPGRKYSGTRHNVGFDVIDVLAQKFKITMREQGLAQSGTGLITCLDFKSSPALKSDMDVKSDLATTSGSEMKTREMTDAKRRNDTEVQLIKPLAYMNLSGKAVGSLVRRFPGLSVVIHDDLDLPPGRLKIKLGGSSGGHKGVQSIIDIAGTKDFIRVKIGIGKNTDEDTYDYVLSRFTKQQRQLVDETIFKAVDAVTLIVNDEIKKAMNLYNVKAAI